MEQQGNDQREQEVSQGAAGQVVAAPETEHQFADQQTNNDASYNLQTEAVERELLNYPMVLEHQQLTLKSHGSHAENYAHNHQHEHDTYFLAANTTQHQAAQTMNEYQTYPAVYETALEAAKPSYNIMTFNAPTNTVDTQNVDAVNALIGEYFGQTSDNKQSQQAFDAQNGTHAHDHSHDHTGHSLVAAPAAINLAYPTPVHGFNFVQPETTNSPQSNQEQKDQVDQQTELVTKLQQAWEQSKQQSEQTAIQLATAGIQHPTLPPMPKTLQQTATNLLSNTTGDNADGIQARREMNAVLKEQTKAEQEVQCAEEELRRAKENLEKAKANKALADEQVCKAADSLTDALLKENTRWNKMYAKLVDFKEKHGHCDVSRNPYRSSTKRAKRDKDSAEQNELVALGTWVGQNRLEARRPPDHPDRIEPYKVIALNRINFDWDPRENYWTEMYEQLKLYLEQNSGKMPPRTINGQKNPLGQWCDTQFENYKQFQKGSKKAYITQEKIDMLNKIG